MPKIISGIYRIRLGRRFYIGQAVNIRKRIRTHIKQLRDGTHWNLGLQIDFTQMGEVALSTEIVLVCSPEKNILAFYEQLVVSNSDWSDLYNIRIQCVISGLGIPASADRKAKISKALLGIKRSDETRAAISRAQAWKHTAEGRAKMALAAKGRRMSDAQKKKLSETTVFRNLSMESRQKSRASQHKRWMVLNRSSAWVLHA